MFVNGDQVVCVDDDFELWAYELYDELPIKSHTYTIRSVSMGRTNPQDQGLDSMEQSVTLNEIKNGIDPHYTGGQKELEFRASRFRKLKETFEENVLRQTATA